MEPGWIALLLCLLIPAGLAAAIIRVQWQFRRLRSWKEAIGVIEHARSVAREVRSKRFSTNDSDDSTEFVTKETVETRNYAEILYSFTVGARTYRGNRVSLAKDPDSAEVVATLKRYPKGKTVPVYYNPKNPDDCILERDDKGNIGLAWKAVASLVGFILAGFVALTVGADWLRGVVANQHRVPLVVAFVVFALVMILFARVLSRKTRAMRKWPKTPGRIVRSDVTTTVEQHDRSGSARDYSVTMYVPRIVYAYEVDGNAFQGDNIGWSSSANTPAVAEKQVKRFPLQTQVQVFYDPDDPTQSTLAPPRGLLALVFWAIAVAFAFGAYAVGWLLP